MISGASGLLGRAVISALEQRGWHVDALVRLPGNFRSDAVTEHVIPDLASATVDELQSIIKNVSCVLHLAAVVPGKEQPGMQDKTVEMARTLGAAMTRNPHVRMIHMSSIYASLAERSDASARQYGHSKLQAEIENRSISPEPKQLIILRPPVVYGEGMSGAMSTLVALVKKGVPLPFGMANEKRAYISKNNIVDLLVTLITAPSGIPLVTGCKIYEPSDGVTVSTRELIEILAAALNRKVRLLPVPLWLLKLAGKLTGKRDLISGAIEPLQPNDNKALEDDFGWVPRETMPRSINSWLANSPER